MENILGKEFRLKNEITDYIEETIYTVIYVEEDIEFPDLVFIYLESEYGDENTECEVKLIDGEYKELRYAKITTNKENLLV